MDSSAIMIDNADDVNRGNFYTGLVCRDCFDYLDSESKDSFSADNNWDIAKAEVTVNNYSIFKGHLHGNSFDNRCWHSHIKDMHTSILCTSEECCTESSFYNYCYQGCFMCGTNIGGDYWDITAVKKGE